jgi:UDP:flavonoid glycosyltransferase YjiC (YdhE family)
MNIIPPKIYDDLFSFYSKIFIPSLVDIDPILNNDILSKRCKYVGPISMEMVNGNTVDGGLKKFILKYPNFIYITFGGSVFNVEYYISSIKAALKKGYAVIVTTGPHIDPDHIVNKFKSDKIFIKKYLNGNYITKKAKIVIHSGGHGTLMQCVLAKTPSITISYNIDQFTFAETAKKIGLSIPLISPKNNIKKINEFETPTNKYTYKVIVERINFIEDNYDLFKNKINKLSTKTKRLLKKHGSREIIDFIEDNI